jgi:hypothetical protein
MRKPIIKKSGESIIYFIVPFSSILFYIVAMTTYCFAEDTWKEVKDLSFKANIAFSKPLTGIYNHGTFKYDEGQDDVKITATGNLIESNGTIVKSFTNLPGILVHGEEYDYFQFDIDQWRVQTWDKYVGVGYNQEIITKVLMRSSISTQDKIQLDSKHSILPPFTSLLTGKNEVRVRNPNEFKVTVGLRSGSRGKNFEVAADGSSSVFVSDGNYVIYFVYSSKPEALFQGDNFSLNNNGIEIQIVKVVGGNYGIRQVK